MNFKENFSFSLVVIIVLDWASRNANEWILWSIFSTQMKITEALSHDETHFGHGQRIISNKQMQKFVAIHLSIYILLARPHKNRPIRKPAMQQ